VAKFKPSPIAPGLAAELRTIATAAARKFGMDALPDLPVTSNEQRATSRG
jgi:hypothetical protein